MASHSAFIKRFYSVCFAINFIVFNRLGSVTPGFDTAFMDMNCYRDSAGVGGAQLHHLSSERVQKMMLLGGRRGPAGSALCAWGLVQNLPSLAGSG